MARIAIDARMYSSHTGIGLYTARLLDQLQSLDNTNQYVIYLKPEEYDKLLIRNPNFYKKKSTAAHYSIAEQVDFYKELKKEKYDLVHFTNFNMPLLYSGAFTVTILDLTLWMFPGQSRNSFLHRLAYKTVITLACRKAKEIIAISQNTKKDIIKFTKAKAEKIQVIYEAASLKEGQKKKQASAPYFLYTGNWRSHKNITTLVKGFEIFCQRHPSSNHILKLTGKQQGGDPDVMTIIEGSPYKNRIECLGFIPLEEMPDLVANAFCYIFPSLYEGFGLPPLDAMSMAVPVIISDASCLPEICEDAALKFNPNSPAELASKMHDIFASQNLQREMSEKGKKQAAKFSWQKTAKETLECFQKNTKKVEKENQF